MMRKDVKLGFAIGGVLLAVLVVYVLVGTGTSSNDPNHQNGAGIVTEDTSAKTVRKVADLNSPKIGEVSNPSTIGNTSGNLTAGDSPSSSTPTIHGPATAPSNSVAGANPNDPGKPRDANNDLWGSARMKGSC